MLSRINKALQHVGTAAYSGWVTKRDVLLSLKLTYCAVVAFLPERYWHWLSVGLACVHLRFRYGQLKLERFSSILDRLLRISAADLERGFIVSGYEENMEAIREILPGGWHPPLRLCGKESLNNALHLNRGVILWVGDFQHSDLVTKKALAEAGYKINHLSMIGHPYSLSRFGCWLLNPFRLLGENRYLARRILLMHSNPQPALVALALALRRNAIVSITATDSGKRILQVPLLSGTVRLAAGAPMLALRTGAALIPVFTVPEKHGGYVVHMGPDISAGLAATDVEERLRLMGIRFASLQEHCVAEHPTQWRGWAKLEITSESSSCS